ncbi:MAG: valine--tRNA ligase, partial [Erysipelotrichales bacterium]
IADDYVTIDTGSGCVKITPAHDPNDFMVGVRHDVPFRVIMNDDATMASNEWVPSEMQGLNRFDARKLFIELAKEKGILTKMVPIVHSVGHSERTNAIVEPLLSKQWFVDMKELAQNSIDFQQQDDKIDFYPERFEKTFLQWMENIEDWCISRQLWWGHQIPAWYHNETGEIYVGNTPPKDVENYTQDEDVLDTWFSSGLWPFSTLGWPEDTDDLKRYYPTGTLVTGYDIIFFWIARMIFTALEFTDQKPFNDVLIHGLVRDSEGRKMSKSLGNGVDPMDVIDKYGADSLRYFLTTNSSPGQDLRYSEEKVESTWNFINKLWNASRYVMMNVDDNLSKDINVSKLNSADKWILSKLNETISEVETNMDKYEYTVVGNALYSFIWDDYCSWYIEMSKATIDTKETKQVLVYVLDAILKMIHPFMPFVSEEIFVALSGKESILLEEYPKVNNEYNFDNGDALIAMELISKFREIRLEYEIKRAIEINYDLEFEINNVDNYISRITNFNKGIKDDAKRVETFVLSNAKKVSVDLSMVEVKSNDEIKAEYQVELDKLTSEIKRAEGMLSNENFVAKAPEAKIEAERNKLKDFKAQYDSIQKMIDEL